MKTNYKSLLIVLILLITINGCEEDGDYEYSEKLTHFYKFDIEKIPSKIIANQNYELSFEFVAYSGCYSYKDIDIQVFNDTIILQPKAKVNRSKDVVCTTAIYTRPITDNIKFEKNGNFHLFIVRVSENFKPDTSFVKIIEVMKK